MNSADLFSHYLAQCPLVAILRGVTPDEVEAIGAELIETGLRIIEVPLNSPNPLDSIGRLARRFSGDALIGAGTVLDAADVDRVAGSGGQLIVSPSTNPQVIHAACQAGLASAPGYFTPSEAFAALEAGAHALKLFPAEAASPAVVKAQRAVLPSNVPLIVVGGVTPDKVASYCAAGADGFGLGSALYVPGVTPAQIAARARSFITALADAGL